ncbi:MAG: hypothetical protein WBA61_02860 [Aequorivita sp.]
MERIWWKIKNISNERNFTATIKLNRNDSLITLNEKLSESTNAVFFAISSIDKIDVLPEALNDDENSIFTHEPLNKMSIDESRINFKNWVLKKGFEDLITALTELMISFSYIVDLNKNLKANPKRTLGEFKQLMFKRNEKNTKLPFPKLIEKVNSSLKEPLKFSEEILSINKVRNCLVHRNGIIHPTDFNIENGLELKWWYYKVELKHGEQKKELKRFDIVTPEDGIITTSILKTKLFKDRQRVSFSFQEFFELSHFCQTVGFDMLDKFELAE